ncbi:MAG: DUF4402 domain-containing protein [Sphingomicrobium sp.]
MGRTASILLGATALAALGGAASPVVAQCRLCAAPTTANKPADARDAIKLEIESSVNFDRLVLFGEGDGSALIKPDGSRSAGGAVANLGPRAMVGSAVIRGEPGRIVRVDLPGRIALHSAGGGTISFDQVTSDLPALPRLDGNGRLSFRFGGRILIRGDAEGDYRGGLPITVEYP